MKKISLFSFCKSIKEIVESESFLEKARNTEVAFTRNRKMPFCDIVYFMISSARRALQTELEKYFSQKGCEPVSRQAYSKTRENIRPEALRELNDEVIEKFEREDGAIQTYKGYRLLSVDGSIIDLPNTAPLKARFGCSENSTGILHCKALAMTVFDVLNKISIFAELYRYDESEKNKIKDIVDDFSEIPYYKKSIWLLDRGYPSFKLFDKLINNNQNFLIRVSSQSLREINCADKNDQVVIITRDNISLKVRVVNISLGNGKTEKLVTNLPDEFTVSELSTLYAKRWGIETSYNFLKNKELIEVFTGKTITAVFQDFYIGILVLNAAAIAQREQDDIIKKHSSDCVHTYCPNKTKLISDIKENWIAMMLAKNPFSKIFKQFYLYSRIKRFAYADIPNRSFPRPLFACHPKRRSHPKSSL